MKCFVPEGLYCSSTEFIQHHSLSSDSNTNMLIWMSRCTPAAAEFVRDATAGIVPKFVSMCVYVCVCVCVRETHKSVVSLRSLCNVLIELLGPRTRPDAWNWTLCSSFAFYSKRRVFNVKSHPWFVRIEGRVLSSFISLSANISQHTTTAHKPLNIHLLFSTSFLFVLVIRSILTLWIWPKRGINVPSCIVASKLANFFNSDVRNTEFKDKFTMFCCCYLMLSSRIHLEMSVLIILFVLYIIIIQKWKYMWVVSRWGQTHDNELQKKCISDYLSKTIVYTVHYVFSLTVHLIYLFSCFVTFCSGFTL